MKQLSTKQLIFLSLLTALNVILQGPLLKLDFAGVTQFGFSFIPSAMIGVLFGPWLGLGAGALSDWISFFLFPSGYPFFLGYTLSAALGPFLYGIFLYKKPLSWRRIFLVVALITLFINIGLGTIWVAMLQGKSYLALLPVRLTKNAVSLMLNTLLLGAVFNTSIFKKMKSKLN